MKKIALLTLLPITLIVAGCSSTSSFWSEESNWNNYDNNSQMANGYYPESAKYIAHDGSVRTYKRPRQYNVTNQDVEKYNAINDRIAKRRAQIQNQTNSTYTQSSNPVEPQSERPRLYNGHYNSAGETNY